MDGGKKLAKPPSTPYIWEMELGYLFFGGIALIIYFMSKKDNSIGDGINRLNNDVNTQMRKLKDPNRTSL